MPLCKAVAPAAVAPGGPKYMVRMPVSFAVQPPAGSVHGIDPWTHNPLEP